MYAHVYNVIMLVRSTFSRCCCCFCRAFGRAVIDNLPGAFGGVLLINLHPNYLIAPRGNARPTTTTCFFAIAPNVRAESINQLCDLCFTHVLQRMICCVCMCAMMIRDDVRDQRKKCKRDVLMCARHVTRICASLPVLRRRRRPAPADRRPRQQ